MDKFFLKSKTVIGVLIAAAPQLLPVFGISFSVEDSVFISAQVDTIFTGIGAALGLYGRATARVNIRLKPTS